MNCVIPFAKNDINQAVDLVEWIGLLAQGAKHPHVLLVSDCGVGWEDGVRIYRAAERVFKTVEVITNKESVTGWPQGANSLFFAAADRIRYGAWLWLEPDALPLRSSWLYDIHEAYSLQGQPFLGHIYTNSKPEFPRKLMSGIGVYPPETSKILFEVQAVAWDMHHADFIVSKATHTSLIYHFWGQKDLPPTFSEFKSVNSPINEMVLENIPKEAVLYHRCKDGSLLRLLRRKMFPQAEPTKGPLLVVIAFCGKDVELCKKNMQWMKELQGAKEYPCLLSYDDYTSRNHVTDIRKLAEATFGEVKVNPYRARNDLGWPSGANLAWQNTATFIQQHYRIPWLWIESDAVPLKSTWLDVLSSQYYRSGKSFFGPVVDERGHCNGVMVYPWNAAGRLPRAMAATNLAWDYVCFPDMQSDHANAEPFIQHVWGWHDNRAHPHAGDAMRFNSVADVQRWVKPQAVLFHRAKDGSLIERLREIRRL
jgi:hypothetical protein